MTPVLFGGLLAVAVAASVADAREHRIPNSLSVAATAVAAVIWVSEGFPFGALVLAVAAFWCLYVLWDANLFGGGDVKFIPPLVMAVAAHGDPVAAAVRVAVFAVVLLGVAIVWSVSSGSRASPLAVGAPLAIAIAVA